MYASFIARRYAFSRRHFDAVHIVALISSLVMGVVMAAAIIILSVFNGYERLILESTSPFDAPLLLNRRDGKVFDATTPELADLLASPEVAAHSLTMRSEGMLFAGRESTPVLLMGLDTGFEKVCDVTSTIAIGAYPHSKGDFLLGADSYTSLGMPLPEDSVRMSLFVPRRKGSINPLIPQSAFMQSEGYITGVVNAGQAEYNNTLFLPISQLADLLDYSGDMCEAIALKPSQMQSDVTFRKALSHNLPAEYQLLTRREQQPMLMRLVAMEKWLSFSIILFVVILSSFNIVCSSAMLIVEKKRDIRIFKAIGMPRHTIPKIFFFRSLITTLIGIVGGLLVGSILLILQQRIGFVTYVEGYIPVPYPVAFKWGDFVIAPLALLVIGVISAWLPPRILIRA